MTRAIAATRATASGTSGVRIAPPTNSATTCPRWVRGNARSDARAARNSSPDRVIAAASASAPSAIDHVVVANPPKTRSSGASPSIPHAGASPTATAKSGTGSASHATDAPSSGRTRVGGEATRVPTTGARLSSANGSAPMSCRCRRSSRPASPRATVSPISGRSRTRSSKRPRGSFQRRAVVSVRAVALRRSSSIPSSPKCVGPSSSATCTSPSSDAIVSVMLPSSSR